MTRPGRSGQFYVVLVVLSALSVALAVLTWRTRAAQGGQIVFKLAHSLDVTHPVHQAMVHWAEQLATVSQGQARLEIFPNEQLGSERELIEQVQLGCIDMVKTSTAPLESFIPVMGAFGVPYVFRDGEHFWQVLDGPIGRQVMEAGVDKGLRGLCFYDSGSRSFYTKDHPVLSPADLDKVKIRVQQSATAKAMVEALGGLPTAVDWGELYTALQQGVVDGAENNPPSFYTSRHYEVCKHYSLDEHTMVPDLVLISYRNWRALPEQVRHWLQTTADQSSLYQRDLWARKTREALQAVQAEGVKVYHPDKEPFRRRVDPMRASYAGTPIGDLLDAIEEVQSCSAPD